MTGNGTAAAEAPPTIESLSAELAHARQLIQLFRQQRDQATTMCNDLQVELALMREAAEAKPQPPIDADDAEQPAP